MSYLVENVEDIFSRVAGHMKQSMYMSSHIDGLPGNTR